MPVCARSRLREPVMWMMQLWSIGSNTRHLGLASRRAAKHPCYVRVWTRYSDLFVLAWAGVLWAQWNFDVNCKAGKSAVRELCADE